MENRNVADGNETEPNVNHDPGSYTHIGDKETGTHPERDIEVDLVSIDSGVEDRDTESSTREKSVDTVKTAAGDDESPSAILGENKIKNNKPMTYADILKNGKDIQQ